MPYVGNSPASNFASVTKDTFSGDGSTTAFTLSKAATTNGVAVFVENVRQEPTTAYAVSGTTLTFTAAPVSASGNNIYVLHHNTPASTATHPAAQALTATSGTFTGAFTQDGGAVFNEASADVDFRVEGNGDANALFVEGESDNVGIGNNDPLVKLDVTGSNSPAATSGTSQTGSLRLSQTGGNGVVDMGFDTTNTIGWIQATNKANLGTNYTLNLNPNGGDVKIGAGDIFFGGSGKGINLGVTSNTDSNTLDDYEEGTWTAGSAVGAFNNSSDVIYTKVGRMVHFHVKGQFSNYSNSEAVEITGLPFAPSTAQVAGSAMWRDLNTNFQGGIVYVTTNSRISFFDDGTTSTSHNQLYHNEIGSSNEVVLSGSYMT